MAAVIKGVFLTIVLATVLLPFDGVDGLNCYECTSFKGPDYALNCKETNSKTPVIRCREDQLCLYSTIKSNDEITRQCGAILNDPRFSGIKPGQCKTLGSGENVTETCVCDKNLCNSVHSAGILHQVPLFVFGLILLTVVCNLGRQHWN